MQVRIALMRMGGVAARASLIDATSRSAVDKALREGSILRVGHGRYAIAELSNALKRAQEIAGVLSHSNAALWHGWEVKSVPPRPHVTVPRNRKLSPQRSRGVTLHRHNLHPDDHDGFATSRELTLLQCLRTLPFDEALAIADSALRHGEDVLLRKVAMGARGPGSPQVKRIADLATALAANPFESVLRALALEVAGLDLEPQVLVLDHPTPAIADLVDRELRLVLEADSFEWHGGRKELMRDARRYNRMVVEGWRVLRFSWEDVMLHPDQVRHTLTLAVNGRTKVERTG